MISEELIQHFFNKQCTDEEAAEVAAWLHAHPEIADDYIKNEETISTEKNDSLSKTIKAEAWHHIHQNIKKQKKILWFKRSAVAACMAGIFVMGIYYFVKSTSTQTPMAHQTKVAIVSSSDTEYNASQKTKSIFLQDGSVVFLLPKSSIWFDTPFAKIKRDIHLLGEARFEVAKNKRKPFTVYAGLFTTTALGTEFIVKQTEDSISVQLMHGKVVIQTIDKSITNWKNIYLLPGEQMIYNNENAIAKVSNIESKKTAFANPSLAANNTQTETPDSLIFNGSPMDAVFHKLHKYYNISILYKQADIKHISFTGVIVKKDSVQNILKVITQMNGLSVQENNNSYTIEKEKTNE